MRQNYSFSKNGNALLEPCEGKLSCTVLRGESPSNGADLLDTIFNRAVRAFPVSFLPTETIIVAFPDVPFAGLMLPQPVSSPLSSAVHCCPASKLTLCEEAASPKLKPCSKIDSLPEAGVRYSWNSSLSSLHAANASTKLKHIKCHKTEILR